MGLSQSDMSRLADLARRLAKAPASETVVADIKDTLQTIAPVHTIRVVYAETPTTWREWYGNSRSVEIRTLDECPPPDSEGTVGVFDKENHAAGFIWVDARDARVSAALALLAPQVWTAMMLHTSLERAKQSSTSEGEMVQETLRARDEERRHIARELHDDLGQSMASLKLSLKWAEDIINGKGNLAEAASELASARDVVGEVLNKIRDLSHTLYPRILDSLGLPSAIKEMVYQVTRHSGIETVCSTRGEEIALPKDLGVALYRCCQEAVNNAVKHSGARKINVEISYSEREIHLTVEDDGKGFDPRTLYGSGAKLMSSGFWTIRQRVTDLGGAFRVSTAHGQGTVIEIIVPYDSRKTDAKRQNKDSDRG